MIQLVIFLVFAALIASIFFAKKDEVSLRSKIVFLVVATLLIGLAWLYENTISQESQEYREMINAFKQGKTLYCDTVEVNAKKFVFISGTLSFVANDKNKDHKGLVIDIATCKTEK